MHIIEKRMQTLDSLKIYSRHAYSTICIQKSQRNYFLRFLTPLITNKLGKDASSLQG